jgi:hypothetical protein
MKATKKTEGPVMHVTERFMKQRDDYTPICDFSCGKSSRNRPKTNPAKISGDRQSPPRQTAKFHARNGQTRKNILSNARIIFHDEFHNGFMVESTHLFPIPPSNQKALPPLQARKTRRIGQNHVG